MLTSPIPGREKQVSEAAAEIEGVGFMAAMMQHQQVTQGA